MYSHSDLKRHVGSFAPELPRTVTLERRIRIGAGIHDKWYASQGKHWRGWMGHRDLKLRRSGQDPEAVPHDNLSHGKAMRAVLPWMRVEKVLRRLPRATGAEAAQAGAAVAVAHAKLIAKLGSHCA